MATTHRLLLGIALAIGLLNLVAVFTCDGREWFVYYDPWVLSCVIVPAFVSGLPALPFLVPSPGAAPARTSTKVWLTVAFLALVGFELVWWSQIAIAQFFRGPDWNFYWPGEERSPKLVPLNSVNLSEMVWIGYLDQPLPKNPLLRELPGLAVLACYLIALPLLAAALRPRCDPRMTFGRTFWFVFIVLLLSGCVAKIILRWQMNLKYVVAFPEQMLNI